MTDRFPILGAYNDVERGQEYPVSVAWDFVVPFAAQAVANHCGQGLRTLASRGGLSTVELWCAAHGMGLRDGWKVIGGYIAAIAWLKETVAAETEWRVK